jgi:hypothetical protein
LGRRDFRYPRPTEDGFDESMRKQNGQLLNTTARFALAVGIAMSASLPAGPAGQAEPAACMEDMPCWDCATMGNLICGPSEQSPNADVTYCPADDTWSATWHPCPPMAAGPNAWDEGAYVGGWN